MLTFMVSERLCTRCGKCAKECLLSSAFGVVEQIVNEFPFVNKEKEQNCVRCQPSLTVFPTGALSIHDRSPSDSQELRKDDTPQFEQMMSFVRGRRCVRRYKDKNVSPGLIQRLFTDQPCEVLPLRGAPAFWSATPNCRTAIAIPHIAQIKVIFMHQRYPETGLRGIIASVEKQTPATAFSRECLHCH